MYIVTKRAVLIYSNDRERTFRAPCDFMGPAPDWIAETKQFDRMVKEGTLVVSASAKDKDEQAAAAKAKKPPRPKKAESSDGSPAAETPNTGETEQ